jgi:hypothetical protein
LETKNKKWVASLLFQMVAMQSGAGVHVNAYALKNAIQASQKFGRASIKQVLHPIIPT